MAAEVAVVAPNIGDVASLARDGTEALLFEPEDTYALSSRMVVLATDDELRVRIARAGRQRVLTTGTWDAQLDRLVRSDAFETATARVRQAASRP